VRGPIPALVCSLLSFVVLLVGAYVGSWGAVVFAAALVLASFLALIRGDP
jgi:hypothetical protein